MNDHKQLGGIFLKMGFSVMGLGVLLLSALVDYPLTVPFAVISPNSLAQQGSPTPDSSLIIPVFSTSSPFVNLTPTSTSTTMPTPMAGRPAVGKEIVIVIAPFTSASGIEYNTEVSAIFQQAVERFGDIRLVQILHSITNETEAQRVSDLYQAKILIYGFITPENIVVRYLFDPRLGSVSSYRLSADFRMRYPRVRSMEMFVSDEMDFDYLADFTFGQLSYLSRNFSAAEDNYSLAEGHLNPLKLVELNASILYFYRGNAREAQQNRIGAIEDYTRTLELSSDMLLGYTARAYTLHRMGEFEAAISDYDRILELQPGDFMTYNNRAVAYYQLGDFEAALESYNQAIEINPEYAEAYFNRGDAWSARGQIDLAIFDHDRAIKIDKAYAFIYWGMGSISGDMARYEESFSHYERYLELVGVNIETHYALGHFHTAYDPETAITEFNEVIALDPTYTNAYWGLGSAYYALERFEESLTNYRRYIELIGDSAPPNIIERVRELEAQLTVTPPG